VRRTGANRHWVALDPHHANQVLVLGDDRTLSRITF
jgi:hypothetical protein